MSTTSCSQCCLLRDSCRRRSEKEKLIVSLYSRRPSPQRVLSIFAGVHLRIGVQVESLRETSFVRMRAAAFGQLLSSSERPSRRLASRRLKRRSDRRAIPCTDKIGGIVAKRPQ